MKKLLILLIFVLVGCNQSHDTFGEQEQKTNTTLEILESVDSTYQVSITKYKVWILQEGLVVKEGYLITNTGLSLFHISFPFILFVLGFFIGLGAWLWEG